MQANTPVVSVLLSDTMTDTSSVSYAFLNGTRNQSPSATSQERLVSVPSRIPRMSQWVDLIDAPGLFSIPPLFRRMKQCLFRRRGTMTAHRGHRWVQGLPLEAHL